MKRIVTFFLLIALAAGSVQAQITPNTEKSKARKSEPVPSKIIKTVPETPPPPPPPAATTKTTGTTEVAPVYSLASVRVKIRTGNDNKEFPSQVYVLLSTRGTPIGAAQPFLQKRLDNEMRINSETEFGLERDPEKRSDVTLAGFQSSGVRLGMRYIPNFFADAWKIESITIVLEFKDQFGNLHPTLGTKTITFSNAYGILNKEYPLMECVTDGSFAPLTAVIKKDGI